MPKQPTPRLSLASFVEPDRIIIAGRNESKETVISCLAGLVASKIQCITPQALIQRIMQREAGISTTLDTGLSIPHARLEGIKDFTAALAVCPSGIIEPAHSGVLIKAVFLFVSSSDSSCFQRHLQLLAALSSAFQPAFIEKISALDTPAAICEAIQALQ
jgi:PTS system nitrogen regulatory IIA component